jgi:malate dehydrogenase
MGEFDSRLSSMVFSSDCALDHAAQAYAAARFAESVLRGLEGEPDVYEAAYVESKVTELPYFASKVRLGPNGAEEVLPLGKLTAFEEKAVAELIPVLKKNIETGIEFAKKK